MANCLFTDVEYRLGEDTGFDSTINEYIKAADEWIAAELTGYTSAGAETMKAISADYAAYQYITDLYASHSTEMANKASMLKDRAINLLNAYKRSKKTFVIEVNG